MHVLCVSWNAAELLEKQNQVIFEQKVDETYFVTIKGNELLKMAPSDSVTLSIKMLNMAKNQCKV